MLDALLVEVFGTEDAREIPVGVAFNAQFQLLGVLDVKGFLLVPHESAYNTAKVAHRAVVLGEHLHRVHHQGL